MNYNKNFVQVPIQGVVKKIEYKAKLEGIKVVKISEEYTSGVSAMDEEEIVKENYKKEQTITKKDYKSKIGRVLIHRTS